MLREHLHGGHFYVTFESMFDDVKEVDQSGIEWIVSDTEIGDEKEICFKAQWAQYLIDQAHDLRIAVFMKEDLFSVRGEEKMIQETPLHFTGYGRSS